MSPIRNQVLLGVILQQAGLVSAVRLKQALELQKSGKKRKIGEILANKGDIEQKTVDFFVERWFELVEEKPKQPIGQYLKQAGLLNDEQIQVILEEQKRTELKFGELAIAKGWLKQATVDFFLLYLFKESNIKQKTEADRATNFVNPVSNSDQTLYSASKSVEEWSTQKRTSNTKRSTSRWGLTVQEGEFNLPLTDLETSAIYPAIKQFVDVVDADKTFILLEEVAEPLEVSFKAECFTASHNISADTSFRTPSDKSDPLLFTSPKSSQELEDSKVHEGFLQIKRKLLKLEDRDSYSETALKRVLLWTGGQSVSTQKLFKLFSESAVDLTCEGEIEQIDYLVRTKFLNDWENNQLGEHLQTIRDRLLNNWQCQSDRLLKVYQEILSKIVAIDRSQEQQELLNMGLVVKQQERLIVANRIYRSIFSYSWVSSQLSNLSGEDNSAIATSDKSKTANRVVSNSSKPNPGLPTHSNLDLGGKHKSTYVRHKLTALAQPHSDAQSSRSIALESGQTNSASTSYLDRFQRLTMGYAGIPPSAIYKGSLGESIADQQRDIDRTIQTADNNYFFQLKNILLLSLFVGLLLLLFSNFAKQMALKTAFWKGNQLYEQELYEQAIAEYDLLLDRDSDHHEAWTYRGYALAKLQRYQEMQQSCSAATIIESSALYAWNCQGEALYNLGRNREAIAAFERAIAIDKTEPIFLINKSKSFKALGKNEESIAVIKEAIEILEQIEAVRGDRNITNEFAVALTLLGNSYIQIEQEQAAIDSYTRALTYVPNYFPAQIGKGIALNMAKRYSQAQNEFNRILDDAMLTSTQQAQTLFHLGQTLCSSQQNILGIATLEKAIDLAPDYEMVDRALERCT